MTLGRSFRKTSKARTEIIRTVVTILLFSSVFGIFSVPSASTPFLVGAKNLVSPQQFVPSSTTCSQVPGIAVLPCATTTGQQTGIPTDWATTSVSLNPSAPTVGDQVTFSMVITTISSPAAFPQEAQVGCFVDSTFVGGEVVIYPGPLGFQMTVPIQTTWTAVAGTHTLTCGVATIPAGLDPNKSNNIMSIEFTVGPAPQLQPKLNITITSTTSSQIGCGATPCSGTYSPNQIQNAYDVTPLIQAGYTGKGVTVALVNSGIDSSFYTDLNAYSSYYGLSTPTVLTPVYAHGTTGTNLECGLGSGETTADAEAIHAMAPDAKILPVLTGLTPSSNGSFSNSCPGPLADGFSYVINNNLADIAIVSPSVVVPNSYATTLNNTYAKSISGGPTLIAASNDWGTNNAAAQCGSGGPPASGSILMPQYSPYVTAVGGTANLKLNSSGGYGSEIGWWCSGGGPNSLFFGGSSNSLFLEPNFQTVYTPGAPQNGQRNIPDIALVSDCQLGIYTPAYPDNPQDGIPGGSGWFGFCGTSAAAPMFAGILADILQDGRQSGFLSSTGRLGFLNPTLYQLGSGAPPGSSYPYPYHNITQGCSYAGSNSKGNVFGNCPTNTNPATGNHWNWVTGWGSLDAARLAQDIIHNPFTTTPGIPGFPTESIFVGLIVGLLVLVQVNYRKRRTDERKKRT